MIVYGPEPFLDDGPVNKSTVLSKFRCFVICRFVVSSFCDWDRRTKWISIFWIWNAPGDDRDDRHAVSDDPTWVRDRGPTRQSIIWIMIKGWGYRDGEKVFCENSFTNNEKSVDNFFSNFQHNEVQSSDLYCAKMMDSRKLISQDTVVQHP